MPRKINPKVSIICGVWNEEKTFEKHLQSFVDQTYKNREVIVVDDESKDKTELIGRKFAKKYKFIKYYRIKHKDGYGCVRPRMEAIKHAKGTILCFVDADAYYDKDYVKNGIAKLFSDKNIGAVVPRMHFWDPKTFVSKYKSLLYEIKFNDLEIIDKEISEAKHSPWILKKEVYDDVGGYNINDAYCEDVKLAEKILKKNYRIVHEGKCHWHHKLEEQIWDVTKKNFNVGRMHSGEKNFNNFKKVGYFSLFPVIIILSIFYHLLFLLLILHALPMFLNGLKILWKTRKIIGRFNSFYSVPVAYLINISYLSGFYLGFIFRYKK